MERRTIGKTGLKVAPLGFGGRGTTEAGVLQRAFDLGVNYFDTGRMYANNERLIGVALHQIGVREAGRPAAMPGFQVGGDHVGVDRAGAEQ